MKNLKETLYSNLNTMSVMEYDKYLEEEKNGFIKIKEHPENENLVILNYTDSAVYERRWTEETLSARGLILDLSNAKDNGYIHILAKPFPKFFNYGENQEYEEGIKDWKIETVMEKMDGSLGISYFFNGQIHFATRGSFTSEQAVKATQIWREKYECFHNMTPDIQVPVTYLVEIIYPENRIVVDYGQQEELVMIGVTYIGKSLMYPEATYVELSGEASLLTMEVADEYTFSIDEMIEMKEKINANEEGWVVKFTNGKRLKIKGDQYMGVHRILHGLSTKAKYKAWSEERLDSYIMQLPEEFRGELENFKEYIDANMEAMGILTTMRFHSALDYAESDEHKDFAKYVTFNFSKEYQTFLFEMKKRGQVPEDKIKYHIYKNYTDYEEGFEEWKKQDS